MTSNADLTGVMGQAVEFSVRHVGEGGLPFVGVVVTADERTGPAGTNQVQVTGDPTAHAEIVAMRATQKILGDEALVGADLLATGEPCSLCYRFAASHGIARVWYAVDVDEAARHGFDYRGGHAGIPGWTLASAAQRIDVPDALEPFLLHARRTTHL